VRGVAQSALVDKARHARGEIWRVSRPPRAYDGARQRQPADTLWQATGAASFTSPSGYVIVRQAGRR